MSYPIPYSLTAQQLFLLLRKEREEPASGYLSPQQGLLPLLLPSTGRPRLISPLRLYSSSILPSQEPLLSNLSFTPDSLSPAFKHIFPEALSRSDDFFLSIPHESQEIGELFLFPITTLNWPLSILPPNHPVLSKLKPHPLPSPTSHSFHPNENLYSWLNSLPLQFLSTMLTRMYTMQIILGLLCP